MLLYSANPYNVVVINYFIVIYIPASVYLKGVDFAVIGRIISHQMIFYMLLLHPVLHYRNYLGASLYAFSLV